MPLRSQGKKVKANADRFDGPAELDIGPPSKRMRMRDVAADDLMASCNTVSLPTLSHLPDGQSDNLSQRCSVSAIRVQAQLAMQDKNFATSLREQIVDWSADGVPNGNDLKEATTQRSGPHTNGKGSHKAPEEEAPHACKTMNAQLPSAFRFMTSPRTRAYYQRDTSLQDNAMPRPISSAASGDTEQIGSEHINDGTSDRSDVQPLLLSINLYSRPVRRMWARERYQHLTQDSELPLSESDTSDWDDESDTPANGVKGNKLLRIGPYGALQLSQKLEMSSTSTLQDLRNAMVCRMDDFPARCAEDEVVIDNVRSLPRFSGKKRATDSCFLIEGQLYSEGGTGVDSYAELLSRHFAGKAASLGRESSASAAVLSASEVCIGDLELRIGEPYWFLHQGSCEHIWVVTSVRAQRPNEKFDPPRTTYLAFGATIRPLVRWTRPNSKVESDSLGNCEICTDSPGCMVVLGGVDARLSINKGTVACHDHDATTGMPGLDSSNMSVCGYCYDLMADSARPARPGDVNSGNPCSTSDILMEPWARAGGGIWTVIPSLE